MYGPAQRYALSCTSRSAGASHPSSLPITCRAIYHPPVWSHNRRTVPSTKTTSTCFPIRHDRPSVLPTFRSSSPIRRTPVISPPLGPNILHPHIVPAMDPPQPVWGHDVSVAHPSCTGSQQDNIFHLPTAHDPLSHPTLNPPSVSPWLPAPRPYPGMTPSSSHEFPPLPDTPPEVTSWPVPSSLYTAGAYHPYTTGHDTSPRISPAAPTDTVWGPWDGNQ